MAVVSRVATIKVNNGAGSTRTWTATAAVQDIEAGNSVEVTITDVSEGVVSVQDPEAAFVLRYVNDAGTVIRSVNLTTPTGSQTDTFFFTDTGLSGGLPRVGTIEIRLQVTRTTGGPAVTYDIETDGSPNTPPTTFTTTQLDRGWIRGISTLVEAFTGPGEPIGYSDTLTINTTTGFASYVDRALSVSLTSVGTAINLTTNSTTTKLRTATTVIDNRFLAALTTVGMTVTVPNAALTGQPDWTYTSVTDGAVQVDPKIYRTPLFQLDDNLFGIPPLSKNVPNHLRLSSQQGFLAERFTNIRGVGLNGLTYNVNLVPVKPGSTITEIGKVSTTQGGEIGWAPSFLAWSSSLPGGTWNKTLTITAPAGAVGASYTQLVAGTDEAYTLVAINPNLFVLAGGGNSDPAAAKRHWSPGNGLIIVGVLRDKFERKNVGVDGTPKIGLERLNTVLGRGEYLRVSDLTWVAAEGVVADEFIMSVSPGDPNVFMKTFTGSETAGWEYDFGAIVKLPNGGTTYSTVVAIESTGDSNMHDGYSVDPIGLAISGVISTR